MYVWTMAWSGGALCRLDIPLIHIHFPNDFWCVAMKRNNFIAKMDKLSGKSR